MGGGGSKCTHPYKKGKDPFKGIINYLIFASDGNPHTKKAIEVTASSTSVRSAAKLEDVLVKRNDIDGEWASNNEPNQWIQFDFKDHKVELRCYTLQTFSGKAGTTHLKSWKVEASDDTFDWSICDEVANTTELNAPNAVLTRPCMNPALKRYIRITQTDKNHFGTNCFTLRRVEFFGNYF